MKNQKGMGHLMLIVCIVIIILAIGSILYFAKEKTEEEIVQTYKTDMLLIQGKIKVLSQESTIQKNEELLKGRKIEDCLEEDEIKTLLEKQIISQEEPDFSKYYVLESSHLEEMGLGSIQLKEGYYLVNYDTDEIIYAKGVKVGDKFYYKLSELKQETEKEEK